MTNRVRLHILQACIGMAVFAILLPPMAWAETSMPRLPSESGNSDQLMVAVGPETEALAARALTSAEEAQDDGAENRRVIRPEEGFQSGTWHLGVKTGYAKSHKIFAGRAPDVQFAPLFFQVGYTITDVHGPFPVRGSLEVIFEPTFLITARSKKTFGEGASLLFRYNFVTGTR